MFPEIFWFARRLHFRNNYDHYPRELPTTGNVGDAHHIGIEAAAELNLLAIFNGGTERPYGRFSLYANLTLLDAEFTSGPSDGFNPSYTRVIRVKTGGIYRGERSWRSGLSAVSGRCGFERESQPDRRASAELAFRRRGSAVQIGDGFHEREPQPRAL